MHPPRRARAPYAPLGCESTTDTARCVDYTAGMPDLLLGHGLSLDLNALTTHGFIVGMTGSGKTGLSVVLVEELLAQGVPVIAIDSKGDLGTLLLRFDPMDADALATWAPDAGRAANQLATALAQTGRSLDADATIRSSYEARLFTPGSMVGLPLDLLGSLAPPAERTDEASTAAADSIARTVLGLLDLEVDPVTSREYLLVVQLLQHAWAQGQTPTLADLVRQVNQPPFQIVGALPLEDFFPQRERQGLMIRLNGLIASPKFKAWRTGDPLDPPTLTRAPDGRPRLSIYSVAHLPDGERVMAVAVLLERIAQWMKRQGGSNTPRVVVLIDEIVGYFPPSPANPATKAPLLTLLKQARAFGVSVVLATQNPIDLDYRGLANIGTWLIGRLQTEQDKARLRDTLDAAAAATGSTTTELERQISTLEPRQFLLHSVHRKAPEVFRSRDALTLLHGPLSEAQLSALAAPMRTAIGEQVSNSTTPAATVAPLLGLAPELGPIFETDRGQALLYLLLKFGVRYRLGTAATEEAVYELAFPVGEATTPGEVLEHAPFSVAGVPFQNTPPAEVTFSPIPGWVAGFSVTKLQAAVKERLPSKLETTLLFDPATKLISSPTETAEAFTARVLAKSAGSKEAQTLMRSLEKRRADLAQVEREITTRKAQKWLDVGAGVLGLFGGRRSTVSAASRAVSAHRMQGGAEARLEDLTLEIQQLEQQLSGLKEVDTTRFSEQVAVPRPADVQLLRLCWAFIVP